jgi:hypothetical protein
LTERANFEVAFALFNALADWYSLNKNLAHLMDIFVLVVASLVLLGSVAWLMRHAFSAAKTPRASAPLIFFVVLLTCGALAVLFDAIENVRGRLAWEKYRKAAEARGEVFDLKALAPPPVPDDQNFAMQQIWVQEIAANMGMEKARAWYGARVDALGTTNPASPLDLSREIIFGDLTVTNGSGDWRQAAKTDLQPWQDYYRALAELTNHFPVSPTPQSPAEDVLLALSRDNAAVETLRAASRLPHGRFPLGYSDLNPANILLPHLSSLKGIAQHLQLRAIAALQAGQPQQALEDITLMLRLQQALRIEPFLISHLVHIAIFHIELQPIWEGLADHRWNEAQLAELDAQLSQLDFLKDFQVAMVGERAFGCSIVNYLKDHRAEFADEFPLPIPLPGPLAKNDTVNKVIAYAIPRGWFDQNKITIARAYTDHILLAVDRAQRVYSRQAATAASTAAAKIAGTRHPHYWFASMLLPAMAKASDKCVQAQVGLDLARVGIALERFRLTNDSYPETLAALEPDFFQRLPHDVLTGQPFKYQQNADGALLLYSVGWNETDDGGTVALTKSGNFDPNKGDWVWRYPAK